MDNSLPRKIRLVLLAMPEHSANLFVARQLVAANFDGLITAVARFPDEVDLPVTRQFRDLRTQSIDEVDFDLLGAKVVVI